MTVRILTFTTLFPSKTVPHHGVFVEQRLQHLLQTGEVTSRVVAPAPWFPFSGPRFGSYAKFAAIPKKEERIGIEVLHPRYPLIPKVGMSMAPVLMALALYRTLRDCSAKEDYDLIDAHYFYPDGVAAVIIGMWLRKPVVVTARGTDINLIPEYAIARKWILWAAKKCAGIITVSDALRERILELGVERDKVCTLRNGVDLDFFRPSPDRIAVRRRLGINGQTLLSVGYLIERKGHHLIIEALPRLPNIRLVIIGEGEMRIELESLAHHLGVADRVRFTGAVSHNHLVEYYNAADALVLASSREGMANVLLESIACGTPVIGTPLWGTPEVISERRAGLLTKDRTSDAIVESVTRLMHDPPSRNEVREYAQQFSWDGTTRGQINVFRNILGKD